MIKNENPYDGTRNGGRKLCYTVLISSFHENIALCLCTECWAKNRLANITSLFLTRHSEYASLPYGGSTKAWTCQDRGPTAAPGLSHIPPTDEIPAKIQAELCWVSEQALWEALSQALCI